MHKSTSDSAAPVAFLGAMKAEIDGLRGQMVIEQKVALHGWSLFEGRYGGKRLLLAQTGVGRRQVEDALEYLLARYSLSGIVSFGFAGALAKELKVADLVLCSVLYRGDSSGVVVGCSSDAWMLRVASEGADGDSVRVGTCVTVANLLREHEERAALREAFGADVVDMESYWVGARAQAIGIPFLAVRAVSDGSADTLPPFDRLLGPNGGWLWSRGGGHFLTHPTDLAKLPGIYFNSRKAAGGLTRRLLALIPRL